MKIKSIYVLLLNLLFNVFIVAQNDNLSFNRIDKKKGLPHSSVHFIYQDKLGFMWFGTEGGLGRYDGFDFKIYKNNPDDSSSLGYNYVTSIYEDKDGIFWIGTRNGLNSFNPATEKFTRHEMDSMFDNDYNWVTAIVPCKNGGIWIGTKGGLYRLIDTVSHNSWPTKLQRHFKVYSSNGRNFVHYYKLDDNEQSLNDNKIYCLTESKNGDLWIGTDNGGGAPGALHLLKPGADNSYPPVFEIFKHDAEHPSSTVGKWIMSVYEDKNGWIWGGTWADGLFRINPETKQVSVFKNNPERASSIGSNNVYQMQEDSDGNLWICTYGGGLNIVNAGTLYSNNLYFSKNRHTVKNPNSLSSDNVKSIYIDYSGVVWTGTLDNGVNSCYYKQSFKHIQSIENKKNSLSYNEILSIYEDKDGDIWFGTGKGTLDRYNPKTQEFEHYKPELLLHDGKKPQKIQSILEFENNSLILGTELGVLKFDPKQQRFADFYKELGLPDSLKGREVKAIFNDSKNNYLFSAEFLLSKTDNNVWKLTYPGFPPFINAIFKDSKDDIWFATSWAGINHYDKNYERIYGYIYSEGAEFNVMHCIAETKNGDIYAGTEKGVARVNTEKKQLTYIRESDGLSSDFVCGILVDNDNNLWISTRNGLSKFNVEDSVFTNFYEDDGLLNNEFIERSFLKAHDGTMYFSGSNGVTVFNPSDIVKNGYKPNVAITSFKIFNRDVKIGEEIEGRVVLDSLITNKRKIELSYKSNVISFEFASLDYQAPEENQFAYMMEGVDNDWVYVSSERRFASYAGLQDGNYIFKVKSSNNDGVWNEKPVEIQIKIIPPYWKTLWFRILAIILAIIIAVVLIRLRTRALMQSKKKLEDKVKDATEEIKSRNTKLQETQSQLTNIIDQVKNQLGKASEELLDATNSQASSIEEISASIGQMTENINENAQGASEMLKNAKDVEKDAKLSVDIVLKTVEAMKEITGEIDYISEFARLTNLLSLNAAIEAARAGIHGKSFAVVAKQIKKLADQSQEVAVNIKKLSESGVKLSNSASSKIVELNSYIEKTVVSIAQISDSSQQQSYEANTINAAIHEISNYVSETSMLSEKLDEAINSLSIDTTK